MLGHPAPPHRLPFQLRVGWLREDGEPTGRASTRDKAGAGLRRGGGSPWQRGPCVPHPHPCPFHPQRTGVTGKRPLCGETSTDEPLLWEEVRLLEARSSLPGPLPSSPICPEMPPLGSPPYLPLLLSPPTPALYKQSWTYPPRLHQHPAGTCEAPSRK